MRNTKTEIPTITITLDSIEWAHFPEYTNRIVEAHLEENEPLSACWGLITKLDGTAGRMLDGIGQDMLAVAAVLLKIINVEAEQSA